MALAASAALLLVLPAVASAYSTAPGYSARDYATEFPAARWGPIGVAFDSSDNLYVADSAQGHLYRFQPGGGRAGAENRVSGAPLPGGVKGLAITRSGRLYGARTGAGDVVEIDPATGTVKRTVVSGIDCAIGIAADPLTDDLFVSQSACGTDIWRVSAPANGPGTKSRFATVPCCVDGLAFASDGTLFAATGSQVLRIEGTNGNSPGSVRSAAVVPKADGVAVGIPGAGENPFLVANRNDGIVTRLDFGQTPPAQSNIFTGGSRGDFVAVDSRGCLFITQTSSVVRITPPGGRCDLTPSTPGASTDRPAPGIVIDTVSHVRKARKCIVSRRLTVRVRQRGRVRLRRVRVYVKGRYRKTVRHRRVSAPIEIRRVPLGRFTVKLVARTTRGRKLTAKKRYRVCRKGAIAHR
jgi:sugar lactone lactonase YvrE